MIDDHSKQQKNPPSSVLRIIVGRTLGLLIVVGAIFAGLTVWREIQSNPQTDDAEVFANLIGIAPEVSGRIVAIPVRDNQLVHKGDVLFEIDPVPYQFALENAESQQAALEGQIKDFQRAIGAQNSAVISARANSKNSLAKVTSREAAAHAAQAAVESAKAELSRTQADLAYAENNVHRLEPLLKKQFVTVDLMDQAQTSRAVKAEAVEQSRARLALAQADLAAALSQQNEAQAGV